MTRAIILALIVAVSILFCSTLTAQVATGTPPFGSFGGSTADVINLGNLNVHVSIPILSKAGRGMSLTYALSYDSSVYYPKSGAWVPVNSATLGWRGVSEALTGYVSYNSAFQYAWCNGERDYITIYNQWAYHDPSGVSHPFPGLTFSSCTGGNGQVAAWDGSGYVMSASVDEGGGVAATVLTPSGKVIAPPLLSPTGSGTVTDSNGNQLSGSASTIYDTLSSTLSALTITGSPTPTQMTYPGPNSSSPPTVTLTYASDLPIRTYFGCSGIGEYSSPGNVSLLTDVQLADGSHYHIQYEDTMGPGPAAKTGRISSLQLPTGGTITYTYTGGDGTHNPIVCSDGSTPGVNRVTPDSAIAWQYSRALVSGTKWNTAVTAPSGDVTQVNFQYFAPNYYETKRLVYSGSSTLLQTVQTCYSGSTPDCTGTTISNLSQQDVYVQLPSGGGKTSRTKTLFDSYGHVTEEDDYDFGSTGSGTNGGLLRQILTTYTTLPSNSLGTTIVVPTQTTVKDGSGVTKAQTAIYYDQGTPTPTSGTPNHVSVTGSRGNLTTTTSLVAGSTTLSKTFTYYDTGGLQTSTDVNGSGSTVTYKLGSSTAANCGNAFPVEVDLPLSLIRYMSWNCAGGVQTGSTDENGNSSGVTYYDSGKSPSSDPFWRPIYSTDPLNNAVTYSYTTTTAETKLSLNSGNSVVDQLSTFDTLGRGYVGQKRQGPSSSNFDSAAVIYDTNGRSWKQVLPYQGTAGQTPGSPVTVNTTYDGANRPTQVVDAGGGTTTYSYAYNDVLITVGPAPSGENSKRRQYEYDGLGRLTSVCEITSATGSGSCGQSNAQTGFRTAYTYDVLGNMLTVSQSGQSRTFYYDGLGRLTSEANPENGTTTYTYDSVSAGNCNVSNPGDLVMKLDAAGNGSCYVHDSLHRVLSIGQAYSGSPNAAATPDKCFVYDSATVNSVTMSNAKGRLARAFTAAQGAGCAATKITDEGFSYSARGEVTDIYQSTPHSGGYYHLAASYWPHGAMKQLSGLSGLPTLYYGDSDGSGLDGEGRYTKVTASSGQAPLQGAAYNSNTGALSTLTYGAGDVDAFYYDGNTGRMTAYGYSLKHPVPSSVKVRFTNDSCSGCNGGTPVGGGDRNLFINNITVGSTTILGNDPSVSYTAYPCNSYNLGVGYMLCNGDMVTTNPVTTAPDTISVNAYGSPDYSIYPHIQLLVNDVVVGEWDVTGTPQTYSATATSISGNLVWNANGTLNQFFTTDPFNAANSQNCYFSYDDLGRIAMDNCGSSWYQVFSQTDVYGNVYKTTGMSPGTSFTPTYNTSTNRINGGYSTTYDNNGNQTNDGLGRTFAWNADGNPITMADSGSSVTVIYDASGRAVENQNGSSYTEIVYGPGGGKLALMNGTSLVKAFVPLPSGAQAVYTGSGLAYYRHADWLGTSRVTSNPDRSYRFSGAYAPYGEDYAKNGTTDLSFTGQNQDTLTDVYDFMYRRYSPVQGRWISPDPAGLAAVNPTNPQTWNRYAYVGNNPMNAVDPLGLMMCVDCQDTGGSGRGFQADPGIFIVDGVQMPSSANGTIQTMLNNGTAALCPTCVPQFVPGAGFAFPTLGGDTTLSWSFSFPTVWAGIRMTSAAFAEMMGLDDFKPFETADNQIAGPVNPNTATYNATCDGKTEQYTVGSLHATLHNVGILANLPRVTLPTGAPVNVSSMVPGRRGGMAQPNVWYAGPIYPDVGGTILTWIFSGKWQDSLGQTHRFDVTSTQKVVCK